MRVVTGINEFCATTASSRDGLEPRRPRAARALSNDGIDSRWFGSFFCAPSTVFRYSVFEKRSKCYDVAMYCIG